MRGVLQQLHRGLHRAAGALCACFASGLLTGALSATAVVSALSVCAAVCALAPAASVSASAAVLPAGEIDASEELSLTITLEAEDTAVSGAEITIYRVADVSVKGGLVNYTVLIGDYDYAGITASESNEMAAELAELLSSGSSSLTSIESWVGVTGADGTVTFAGLKQGMFLVVLNDAITWESDGQTLQYIFEPYLIAVPLAQESEDGDVCTWLYAVQSLPKIGALTVTTVPSAEESPSGEESPSDEDSDASGGDDDGDDEAGSTDTSGGEDGDDEAGSTDTSGGEDAETTGDDSADVPEDTDETHPEPEISKEVSNEPDGEYASSNTAKVGDTVYYRAAFTAQPGAESYVLHDTMEGLTFDASSVSVAAGGTALRAGVDYTVLTGTEDGCDFELWFSETWIDSLTESVDVVIDYAAVINESAVIGGDGNPNELRLQYSDPFVVVGAFSGGQDWPSARTVTYVKEESAPPDEEDEPDSPWRSLLTGDDSILAVWLSLAVLAGLGVVLILTARRRRKDGKES